MKLLYIRDRGKKARGYESAGAYKSTDALMAGAWDKHSVHVYSGVCCEWCRYLCKDWQIWAGAWGKEDYREFSSNAFEKGKISKNDKKPSCAEFFCGGGFDAF